MLDLSAVILPRIAGGKKWYNPSLLSWSYKSQSGLRIGYLHRGRVIFLLTGHNLRGSIQIPQELDHGGLDQKGFVFHPYPDRCILIREYGLGCEGTQSSVGQSSVSLRANWISHQPVLAERLSDTRWRLSKSDLHFPPGAHPICGYRFLWLLS